MSLAFNADDARQLLDMLDQVHLVAIWPEPSAENGSRPIEGRDFGSEHDAALSWAADKNALGWNIHWTPNAVRPGVHKKPSRKAGDIIAARFAHCDIDPPKGGKLDRQRALAELDELQCPPSFIIDSGNGLQPLWRLAESIENWQPIEAINTSLRDRLGADACQNIDRLLRVPGTINWPDKRKRARGYSAVLAGWARADDGVVYTPEQLAAAFPCDHSIADCDAPDRSGAVSPDILLKDEAPDGAVGEYRGLVEQLYKMAPPMSQSARILADVERGWEPVRLSAEARAVREQLEGEHLQLVESLETVNPKLASHFGKHNGLFARLVLLWHCIDHANHGKPPPEINGQTADRVASFMREFLRPSAIAFYAGMLGMSAGHEQLMALASLIVARSLHEVKARDVQSSGQAFRHVTADAFRLDCEKLEAFGWLERRDPGPNSRTPRWIVNPRVHELFADRARIEIERRERARVVMRDAFGR